MVSSPCARIATAAASFSVVIDFRPSSRAPSCAGGLAACLRPLADQLALELGKRGEQVQLQPPSRRAGVNRFRERPECDLALLQLLDEID